MKYNNSRFKKVEKKCHNCKGNGTVTSKERVCECYYCRGKGSRTNMYGRDKV